jgi:hypothetical protein
VIIRYRRNASTVITPTRVANSTLPALPNTIRTKDLFFLLDPANPACFTPGNTVCYNLVTTGLVTGASGTPGAGLHTPDTAAFPAYSSFGGGTFDFTSGTRGMNFEENLGTSTELTYSIWFYKTNSDTTYFSDARNDGGQWFLSNYIERNINFTGALSYNFNGNTQASYLADGPNFLNRWYHLTVVSTATTGKLFLNGIEVTQYVNQGPVNMTFGRNFRIGTRFTTSGAWVGYFGPIYAYKKELTVTEIQQNFITHRGRYGI